MRDPKKQVVRIAVIGAGAVGSALGALLHRAGGNVVLIARPAHVMATGIAGRIAAAKVRQLTTKWPLWGSTLQSIRRGCPTEIDYLNGEIVALGKRCGEATPLNSKIVELVHQVEQTGRFLPAEEITRTFYS